MTVKNRLIFLMSFFMLIGISSTSAQGTKTSQVTIELKYEDAAGKKHSETKLLTGQEAEDFDAEVYKDSLKKRNLKILNLNINKSATEEMKEGIHQDHKMVIQEKGDKKSKKTVTITKEISSDAAENEMKGGEKKIKIIESSDDIKDMHVEVKDDKVFINGEEVDVSSGNHIIIKKMGSDGDQNIWISDEDEDNEFHFENEMIFIGDDEAEKPRLGIMIEDAKTVNGAAIIEVVPDSPAAKAGLQTGDVVTALNDAKVYGVTSMMAEVSHFKAGDEVSVSYVRDGKSLTSSIKVAMMDTKQERKVIIKEKE